jgi:hypothetical protein
VEALATKILTAAEPAIESLFKAMSGFLQDHQGDITKGINELSAWATGGGPKAIITAMRSFADQVVDATKYIHDALHPVSTIGKGLGALGDLAHESNQRGYQAQQVAQEKADAEKKYGLPAGLLDATKVPLGPGSSNAFASILADEHAKIGGNAKDPDWYLAVQALQQRVNAMHAAEGGQLQQVPGPNPNALKATQGASGSPAARATAAKADANPPTAANSPGGVTNNVTGDIFVQTQAKDANGVAGAINGALQRKLTVSQSDGALS